MKEVISVTEGQYRNQVVQYDTSTILELCHRLSLKLLRENKNIIGGTWPYGGGGVFHITQHKIALLVMITLGNYKYARGRKPSNKEFIALVNNVSTIDNPTDKTSPSDPEEAKLNLLVPIAYQQFPFQEGSYNVIPRHLLIYLYSKVQSPALSIDSEAYQNFGLHINEYLTIGMAFYGASLAHSIFDRSFLENTTVKSIKNFLTPEKVEKFLVRTSADFDTFRKMCMQEINDYPDGGTYRFNTLFDRPIIIRRDGRFCIPVPMLILYVITKGLYYDFLDLFSGQAGNPFAEWFGHAFEYYGGLLLKNTLGKQNVFPEPVYGKEQKRGPDWTFIQGNSAVVFEFRSGRLNKRTKIYGNYAEISALVKRNILEPLIKLPGKIEDIKSGLTDIPSNSD
ncbi:MAG: hypothetical protein KAV40_05555, partial [Thermoplasmatales archaeon]|nr:hypothetical protein [Thermoplasmatales archaeon]